MKKLTLIVIAIVAVAALASAGAYAILTSSSPNPCAGTTLATGEGTPTNPSDLPPLSAGSTGAANVASGTVIQVVAGENFWGSLVAQLGGNRTSVLSIVNDPNADPHEYQANTSDAQAFGNAHFVIVNGVGYDDWALQLITASAASNQVVLNVGNLNGVSVSGGIVTGNPHMWYNPTYVNHTVAAMYSDLVSIQPSSTSYFQGNYAALNVSLGKLDAQANAIRDTFAGTTVASTESIFVYLANYTRLNLVSPPEFMKAVAEGNDPPTQSVVTFQCQLQTGKVSVLVYNEQTVTPITSNVKTIAADSGTATVGITETIQPPTSTFQEWMGAQYIQIYNALNANALAQ
ncbi:MAG: metal ABC transporter solute-binding protein, Zn/Mn family [Thermoplasmata archaeon]